MAMSQNYLNVQDATNSLEKHNAIKSGIPQSEGPVLESGRRSWLAHTYETMANCPNVSESNGSETIDVHWTKSEAENISLQKYLWWSGIRLIYIQELLPVLPHIPGPIPQSISFPDRYPPKNQSGREIKRRQTPVAGTR